jgi:hypothetical protein
MLGKLPCQVHGSERVLEAAVFSGGVDPAGALQLIDIRRRCTQGESIKAFSVTSPFFSGTVN